MDFIISVRTDIVSNVDKKKRNQERAIPCYPTLFVGLMPSLVLNIEDKHCNLGKRPRYKNLIKKKYYPTRPRYKNLIKKYTSQLD